jgi:hypothetical protein
MSKKKTNVMVSLDLYNTVVDECKRLERKASAMKGQYTKLKNMNEAGGKQLEFVESERRELISANMSLKVDLDTSKNAYQGLQQTTDDQLEAKDKLILEKLEEIATLENNETALKSTICEYQVDENALNGAITVLLDRAKTGQL